MSDDKGDAARNPGKGHHPFPGAPAEDDEKEEKEKENAATRLTQWAMRALAAPGTTAADLWHTPEGETFATLGVDGHRENVPVRTRAFRRWLYALYFAQAGGKAPNAQAVEAALNTLDSLAATKGTERRAPVRLAEQDGNIYLDLADSDWRAVEVTPEGWSVIENPPVRFRRAEHMEALPAPTRGGSLDDLRRFTNVTDDAAWVLVKGFLVMCLNPFAGAYPILLFNGGQGSAKTAGSARWWSSRAASAGPGRNRCWPPQRRRAARGSPASRSSGCWASPRC